MPSTPPLLVEFGTRHQAHMERLKSGYVKQYLPLLKNMQRDVMAQLAGEEITDWTRRRLNKQLTAIRGIMRSEYQGSMKDLWRSQLNELAEYEAGFEARSLKEVVLNYDFDLPSETQLTSAVFTQPLQVHGADGGKLLESFYDDWTTKQINQASGILSMGFAQGRTTAQIVRDIRDFVGPSGQSARGLDVLARTSLQHAANQARQATWEANSDIVSRVRWVSTLDSRTSTLCRSLDGQEYPLDSGPRPPAHPNACLPGTMIKTIRGNVPIEHIKVGDMVKTHTGTYKRVYTVMARHHDGVCRNLIDNFGRRVSLTNEHPILTMRKGWVEVGQVDRGDIFFNDSEQLNRLDSIGEPSFVPQAVLNNSHNIETFLTEELVSYGIFSGSRGMTSAIKLNQSICDDEIGIVREYPFLGFVSNANLIENRAKQNFMGRRVFFKALRQGVTALDYCVNVARRVIGDHSFGRLKICVLKKIGPLFRPMFFSNWLRDMSAVVSNRLYATLNRHAMNAAPIVQGGCANSIFPFNQSNAFAFPPMFNADKFFNKFFFHGGILDKKWLASTCTLIEEYHYSGYVYNLAVEDDETYLANGFVVHNCRSTTVAALDDRFKTLEEGATRRERDPETGEVGYVAANETYYGWLKRQPYDVQESIIGPTRAKLLNDGGLSAERFAELQIGRRFEPLTLDEMRELEPVAFQRAGLD